MVNELALFAGAGGGILGGTLLGWRTVCAIELDPYAASVLLARQNDGVLPPFPIWDDIRTFDGKPWRGFVDVVSGGFPCQDISCAGKGAGIEGERSGLWREMAHVVREVRPEYVFVENSPMLTLRGLDVVLGDLAAMGYDAEWGVLGADDSGAPHIRKRIWILGYFPDSKLLRRDSGFRESERQQPGSGREARGEFKAPCKNMAYTARILKGRPEQRTERERTRESGESIDVPDPSISGSLSGAQPGVHSTKKSAGTRNEQSERLCGNANIPGLPIGQSKSSDNGKEQQAIIGTDWWLSEPDVGRVAHGVAARVDRLKAIGNGQVPAVAALAWKTLINRRNGNECR